jgi:hypothetical protein
MDRTKWQPLRGLIAVVLWAAVFGGVLCVINSYANWHLSSIFFVATIVVVFAVLAFVAFAGPDKSTTKANRR